jgi:hypothetical protein
MVNSSGTASGRRSLPCAAYQNEQAHEGRNRLDCKNAVKLPLKGIGAFAYMGRDCEDLDIG